MSKIKKGAIALALALLLGAFAAIVSPPIPEASAVTCFKTGERISGMNKICYYDCLGSAAAITIQATQLCPLTIDR